MKNIICTILPILLLFLFPQIDAQENASEYSTPIMSGLSNHGKHKTEQYITAGDRAYLIGTQDGNFPDLGRHVKGEMGGLWLHPIKLVDGFWVELTDPDSGNNIWLSDAAEFINYPYGNRIKFAPVLNGIEMERFQFCPDGRQGCSVQFNVRNVSTRKRNLKFAFSVKTDLSPVWLSEQLGIKDSADKAVWDDDKNIFVAQDSINPWFVVWGSADIHEVTIGQGTTSIYDLMLEKNGSTTLNFNIAGSAKNKSEAIDEYNYLAKNHSMLLETKKKHYSSVIQRARIKIPDRSLQEVFNWIKVNNEWLIRDVPAIGRGLVAGYPEYPWWFGCDSTYSLQAVMATGDFDLAKQTLRLLKNESMKKNGNGRIIHEVSTNGVVYNPGNTQETAHFIMCVEKFFQWTGDLDFIKEMYPVMKMGIQWLLSDMDQNKNLFPEGYGIMEVHGLNAELIDVAVYTQQALKATARIASVLNEPQVQKDYDKLASDLEKKINEEFWDEAEGSYCDFYGTKSQAISAAEGAITQIKKYGDDPENDQKRIVFYEQLKRKFEAMPEISKGWLTNKNWVITTPMETGIAPKDKAIKLLNKIRSENVGAYGPYLAAVEKNAMMTISTGVQAVSEAMYGRMDESMWYVNKIVQTFNRVLPGSITEMMPDYGDFTQAWTAYGIVVPLIQHVFGIYPDAIHKSVTFEPQLPTGWENISIADLPVGNNVISFSRTKTPKGIEYTFNGKEEGWKLILKIKDSIGAKYYLNGKQILFDSLGIQMNQISNKLLVIEN